MGKTGKVTVDVISQKAGVSTATVSRVLNDSPLVHPRTKRKVLRIVQELNYVPNALARNLSLNRTDTIGVIFPWLASGFYSEVLRGIDDVARGAGFHIILGLCHSREHEPELALKYIREQRTDGIIILDPAMDEKTIRDLAAQKVPFVLIDRALPNQHVSTVMVDDFAGARDMTRHLLDQGYKNILFVTGNLKSYDARERLRGYQEALKEAGVPLKKNLILESNFTREDAVPKFEAYLEQEPLPEAIFASNDEMALGIYRVLTEHGKRVPGDVALAGFDGIETTEFLGMTTAKIPMRDMGAAATKMLLEQIARSQAGDPELPASQKVVLQTQILVRKTTLRRA
ncbi:MAG: LacI family DNA-binding transcriptional regulator [Verrucomicrobiae bacterium]|nr:LacI family DNA-binding transcriptional regulator [Verrucomicrobiae bacterium]